LPFIYITLSGNEYTTYKGKPRPKFGYNPNDFTWGRDEKGLLFCKDSKGKIRFKEKVSSLRVSKTNEIENTESKIQKPTPKKKTTKHPVKDLDKVKSGLEKSKDATLAQLKKQFVLTKAQANELVKSKLVTKEEIADVVEK